MNKLIVDEDSVSSILSTSLSSLLKQSSRKHKQLRDQCETGLKKITEDDKKANEAEVKGELIKSEGRADIYFPVFYYAVETQQTKLQALALEHLQKLFANGYISGKSKANATLYPPKPTSSTNAEGRLLINVIIDTISECAAIKDNTVQLNVIKCLLTAISSVQSSVHDHALLTAIIALYQIYLNANDEVVKITAKATLTQVHQLIFARMEHFGQQLRQLEQTYINYVHKHQEQKDNYTEQGRDGHHGSREKASANSETAANGHPHPSDHKSTPPSSIITKDAAHPGQKSRGRCGVCCVCGIAADHYCSQTKDPVCSMNCKIINLQRKDPEMKRNIAFRKQLQSQSIVYQCDSYLLFRALLRLAYKALPAPPENTAVESKLLALHLLLSILNYAGPIFRSSPPFIQTVKVDLVNCLLRNSAASSIDTIFSLSSSIFVAVISHFKPHLHKVIGPVLDSIYLPYIASPHSSFDHKYISLTVISKICADPQTLVELFLNYDCDMDSYNTFQKIAAMLEKSSHSSRSDDNQWMSKEEERQTRELALRALVSCMKVLVHWTTRRTQLAKEAEEAQIAANAAASKRQSSPASIAEEKGKDNDSDDESNLSSGGPNSSSGSNHHKKHNEDSQSSPSSPVATDSTVDRASNSASPLPSIPSFSDKFQQQRQQKLRFDTGVFRFNSKPKAGIKYLQEHGLIGNSPDAVAHFLHTYPGLDKTAIGEYMGDENPFQKQVMFAFVEQLDFRGLLFDDAIRHFVGGFRLPGEAQKIDRMMEKFAEQYHKHNPGVFSSADTAYVLAYSVIMLNVDAHNPQVKHRMTKEEFFRNTRGIDDGKDINPIFLADIYERITTNEIKMKTENTTTVGASEMKRSTSLDPKSRQSMFVAESQQRIKAAEQLVSDQNKAAQQDGAGNNKNNANTENVALNQLTATIGGTAISVTPDSVDVVSAMHQRNTESGADRSFYLATDSDCEIVKPMFEILWFPALATFSMILEESDADVWIDLCLDGYRLAIKVSNELELDIPRLAFVSSLRKFTLLGSSKQMKSKNLQAVKVLLTISHQDGNRLKESWIDVLQCISEVERLHLVGAAKPENDVFRAAAMSNEAGNTAGANRTRESDTVNSQAVHRIDASAIDRVFTGSANLNDRAIIDFVTALRQISEVELSNPQHPLVFGLQKAVEVTSYNMGRIRLVWNKIWAILSEYFIKAGCHPNLQVSMFAIDSVRQLAMKFLEKDELTSYQFQKQFFKPFESIMLQNTSSDTRELIVQCLHRMIASRANNIKSGWKAVFVVLGIAAKQNHPVLVNSAFDLLTQILDLYFNLITESSDTLDECISCLVQFGCNSITEVAIKAIQRLQIVADYLGQYVSHSQQQTPVRRLSIDTTNKGGGYEIEISVDSTGTEHRALALTPHSSSLAATAASTTSNISNQGSHALRLWFLLLTGLSRLVGDPRLDVRNRALEALFAVLNKHGGLFTAATWRHIFHGVLFPIFDDVRHASEQNKTHVLLSRDRAGSKEQVLLTIPPGTQPANTQQLYATSPSPSAGTGPSTPSAAAASAKTGKSPPTAASPAPAPAAALASTTPAPVAASGTTTPAKPRSSLHAPVDYSWLQTTCYQALNTLVELFHRFHVHVSFLLPELLSLITSCIEGENDDLAKIGLKCLVVLCSLCGQQFTVSAWWLVLDAIMDVLHRLLPHQIQSNATRVLLGLPPITAGIASPASAEKRETSKGTEGSSNIQTHSADQDGAQSTTTDKASAVTASSTSTLTTTASTGGTETSAAAATTTGSGNTPTGTTAQNGESSTATASAPSSTGAASSSASPAGTSTATTHLNTTTTPATTNTTAAPVASAPAASTAPAAASIPVLPFTSLSVSIRCRSQVLLMDALYEIVMKYFPVRPTPSTPYPTLAVVVSASESLPPFVDPFHSPTNTQESLAAEAAATGQQHTTLHQPRFNFANTRNDGVAHLDHDDNTDYADAQNTGHTHHTPVRVNDRRIYGYLTCAQLFFALEILGESISFTHTFNADLTLRRKLFGAGFIMGDATNRLPQLFTAEAHSTKLTMLILFHMYKEGCAHSNGGQIDSSKPVLPSFLLPKQAEPPADIIAPLSPSSVDPAVARESDLADYEASVVECERLLLLLISNCLSSYRSKVKSGQLSALESVDQVIVAFLDEYTTLVQPEFLKHLPQLYPIIVDLVEDAQADTIRSAVRQFLRGPIATLLPLQSNMVA